MITCFTSNTQNTRKKIVTSNFKKKIYFFMLLWLSYSEWHCVLVTLRIKVILIKFCSFSHFVIKQEVVVESIFELVDCLLKETEPGQNTHASTLPFQCFTICGSRQSKIKYKKYYHDIEVAFIIIPGPTRENLSIVKQSVDNDRENNKH